MVHILSAAACQRLRHFQIILMRLDAPEQSPSTSTEYSVALADKLSTGSRRPLTTSTLTLHLLSNRPGLRKMNSKLEE